MTPEQRKQSLTDNGYTQVKLAAELEVSTVTVFDVIHDKKTSRRVQDAICSIIKKPRDQVWGNK